MMMGGSEILVVLMLLFFGNNGGNEVLDYVDSESYWRQQGIEMNVDNLLRVAEKPEVNDGHGPKAADVQRLMAIRGLGELKSEEALVALFKYAKSRDLFVADYATEAIAAISDEKAERVERHANLVEDLAIFPEDTGVVAQWKMYDGPTFDVRGMLKLVGEMMGENEDFDIEEELNDTMVDMQEGLIEFVENTGNIRIDAISFGVADHINNDKGWIGLNIRGLYDSEALSSYFVEQEGLDKEDIREMEGVNFIAVDDEVLFSFVSDTQFVFMGGPDSESLPTEFIAKRVKEGTKQMALVEPLQKLVKSTKQTGPLWVAALVTGDMKPLPYVGTFKTICLETEMKEKSIQIVARAEADNEEKAEKAAEAIDEIYEGFAESAIGELEDGPEVLAPLIGFVESVQFRTRGNQVVVSGELEELNPFGIIGAFFMAF